MLRSLNLISSLATASILLIAETASIQPQTASANYPVVSVSDSDKLVCYMETANGTALDLSSLCEEKSQVQSEVVISYVGYEDQFLIGRVVNRSSKTVHQARVNYEVLGESGNVVERGAIATEPSSLSPGQTAMFMTLMPDGGNNVRTTSVEWDE
jgi:hypothetical protein